MQWFLNKRINIYKYINDQPQLSIYLYLSIVKPERSKKKVKSQHIQLLLKKGFDKGGGGAGGKEY